MSENTIIKNLISFVELSSTGNISAFPDLGLIEFHQSTMQNHPMATFKLVLNNGQAKVTYFDREGGNFNEYVYSEQRTMQQIILEIRQKLKSDLITFF